MRLAEPPTLEWLCNGPNNAPDKDLQRAQYRPQGCIRLLSSFLHAGCSDTLPSMTQATQPNVKFVQTPDYRETYANSVQIRVNVWDFFLVFGTLQQASETQVELRNFQGVFLSPQQAKALMALLQQNVANYEAAFGEIKLDPRAPGGPVH